MIIMKVISQVAIFAAFCLLDYSSHSVQLAPKSWVNDRIRDSISANDPTFSNEVNAVASAAWTNSLTDTESPNFALFSNAVLSVGLNIDTNSVAVLNEIAATFGDFPITGTATTVGGLLAALAAAVAWLKRKTAEIETNVGTANANLEDALNGEVN